MNIRTYRQQHNIVRATLFDICFLSGISTGKEIDLGLGSSPLTQTEMIDFVSGCAVIEATLCKRVESSPLTQTGKADLAPGRAVIDAAQCKHVKHEAKCATIVYRFLPFSFSSLGELREDAVSLLKRI
ncbi:hypothetical protein Tco_0644522 [Tanacetum coccineum]